MISPSVFTQSGSWMSSAEIEKKPISKKTIAEYQEIIIQSIYPYLTKKGVSQYQALI